MERNEIRLHYSGFIIFAAQILSLATGLIFTLLLTRNLTKQEYGIWANIFDLTGYFLLSSGVFPFWTMRYVAHRRQGGQEERIESPKIAPVYSHMSPSGFSAHACS